ncbi:MAG: hypothetical protein V8S58_02680 [Lachnospiraceae bacterium]
MTEETFLLKYGICEFVEKQGVLTAVIRSEKEKDKTAALVNAAYKKLQGREYFVAMQDCFYAMGFEEGSQAVIKAMMVMGSDWLRCRVFRSGCRCVRRTDRQPDLDMEISPRSCLYPENRHSFRSGFYRKMKQKT